MLRLEHVGIAVRDATEAAGLFEALTGRSPYAEELVESEGVRTIFLEAGPVKLELLESTDPESPLGRFLERRGPGLHHLAFEVPDIEAAHTRLAAAGFRVLGEPHGGADRKRIFFMHPSDTAGVLVECCASEPGPPDALTGEGPAGTAVVLVLGGREDAPMARALSRRLRTWYDPAGITPAGLPAGHHLVVFGDRLPDRLPSPGSPFRTALIDPPPARIPIDRADFLVVRRSSLPQAPTAGPVVSLPADLLARMPDPDGTLSDVITAYLTA